MNLRDLFTADDEEQRRRVDGPTLQEVAASCEQPYSGYQDAVELEFRTGLPGDDMTGHPTLPAFNPYLFVPGSELEFLLKRKKDLSAESRQRIAAALRMLAGA